MGGKLFFTGLVLTVAYLAWIAVLSGTKLLALSDLDFNAIGDFFAGAFAPPAFLWLVLGFIQQGAELKSSVETLKLQANELSLSVEQQKELVRSTRQQVIFDQQNLDYQLKKEKYANNPLLAIECTGGSGGSHGRVYHLIVVNAGASVIDVEILPSMSLIHPIKLGFPYFMRDGQLDLDFSVSSNEEMTKNFVTIWYLTADGRREFQIFDILESLPQSRLKFQRRNKT